MKHPIQSLSGNWLVAFVTIANAFSMGWYGYDQGVISGVLISDDFIAHFPQTKNSNISGITSSCFSLGAFIGAIFAFTMGDKLGRKRAIILGLTCNAVGAILQIAAFQFPQFIAGRIINGFGMGVTSSTCPIYQAECSKPRVRGKLVVIGSLSNTAAVCLSTWMNFGLHSASGPYQWRFPLAFQLVFPIIAMPILLGLPDSPRWLVLKDRNEEAVATMARLMGRNVSHNDPELIKEMLSIQTTMREEREAQRPWSEIILFKDQTQNMRRVILSCGTQLMQQFTGVNALGYYLPTILEEQVGFSSTNARLLTACNATSYLLAAFICLIVIDLAGRRKLMLYGALTTGSCYLIAAITLKEADLHPEKKHVFGSVTTSMFFFYYFFYGTSFAKVPWVYNSEVNSLGWRARGAAAATGTNWICSFCITQFTKTGVKHLGWGFYLLFTFFCYSFFPVVYLFYPETSNRTLEDIDEIFIQNPSPFVLGKRDLTQRRRPQAFVDAEFRRIEVGQKEGLVEGADDVLGQKHGGIIAATTHVEELHGA